MKPEWTKTLTPDNFNDWIKGEVDAGRTAFVRWIASEGWCAPPSMPSRRLLNQIVKHRDVEASS